MRSVSMGGTSKSSRTDRLVYGLYNLEASFTILFNMPPRILAEEVNVHMPCTAQAYFAKDKETCYEAAHIRAPRQSRTLSQLSGLLFESEWDNVDMLLEDATILDLFILVSQRMAIIHLQNYNSLQQL